MSVQLRKRKLPSGTIQLYLDLYIKGERKTEALSMYLTADRRKNQEILRLAEAIRAKRHLELHAEAQGLSQPSRKRMNVVSFAESVYQDKKEWTQRTYKNAFDHFSLLAGENTTFEQLNPRLCERFKTYLLENLKPNSAAAYFERFRGILKKAVREGIISQNPAQDISVRKVESLPKYLTESQLKQLAKTPCGNQVVRNAFFFSCFTGMRYGDVAVLNWNQINDGGIVFTQSKTGVGERLPLNKQAAKIIQSQKKELAGTSKLVFPFPRRSTVDKVLKHWAVRAGLDISLSFHKARHTFATLMLSKGNDIYTTSKLLGHKNLATTQIYARVIDEKKQSAINTLPSIKGI